MARGRRLQFTGLRTDVGHAAVVRNGHHPARPFQTGIGPVSVRIPKVRSKDSTPVTFRSALVGMCKEPLGSQFACDLFMISKFSAVVLTHHACLGESFEVSALARICERIMALAQSESPASSASMISR